MIAYLLFFKDRTKLTRVYGVAQLDALNAAVDFHGDQVAAVVHVELCNNDVRAGLIDLENLR